MSNERIDLTQFEESFGSLLDAVLGGTCTLEDGEGHLHDRMHGILFELKRCYEEIDRLRPIAQDWVKLDAHTDDGKCLILDMEDSDGNCFSGYINRASK